MEFFKPEDFEPANIVTESIALPQGVTMTCYSSKKASDIANRLLRERGTVVYGWKSEEPTKDQWVMDTRVTPQEATHTAFLINIEPIQKDTAEQILRDMIETFEHPMVNPRKYEISEAFVDRAKKVLEKTSHIP